VDRMVFGQLLMGWDGMAVELIIRGRSGTSGCVGDGVELLALLNCSAATARRNA